jgi:hypothetical protein
MKQKKGNKISPLKLNLPHAKQIFTIYQLLYNSAILYQ